MTETVEIEVLYHSDEVLRLEYIAGKSDWVDLRSAERVVMKKGDFKLVNLGISVRLPEGFEAHVVPRSSLFRNYGLIQTNSMGVIDNSYSGADDVWMVPLYATRDTVVEKGDRICQFRIMKNQPLLTFKEVGRGDGRTGPGRLRLHGKEVIKRIKKKNRRHKSLRFFICSFTYFSSNSSSSRSSSNASAAISYSSSSSMFSRSGSASGPLST